MAISVLLIMSLSSIAYVFYDVIGQPTTEIKPLTTYVVEGDINPQLESLYIQSGWTLLKVYDNGSIAPDVRAFIDQTPASFTTNQGQSQMIVQKYNGSRTYAVISNQNTDYTINDVTIENLNNELCNSLVVLPTECALRGLNLTY